ncbi:MAG: acyl-CoA thioesterase [Parvularculaceae bacterium]|nr:MAG: acyl-CoA thioesterase [Parvularculaceae bacterium]
MPNPSKICFPVLNPFLVTRVAGNCDLDEFGHVNNVRYVAWAMDAAWAHSKAIGMSFAEYDRIGAGFVVQRHDFKYLAPVHEGDEVTIATWIDANDGRVRLIRRFEIWAGDDRKCFAGATHMVAIDLKSGRPTRMPKEFVEAYPPAARHG